MSLLLTMDDFRFSQCWPLQHFSSLYRLSIHTVTSTFRANPKISTYGDTTSERGNLFRGLEKLIVANPLLRDKLQFPVLGTSRLRTLIGQRCLKLVLLFNSVKKNTFSQMIKTGLTRFSHSLKWQHHLCKNPMPNPDIDTLFVDHTCDQPIAVSAEWLCSLYYSMEIRLFYAQVCFLDRYLSLFQVQESHLLFQNGQILMHLQVL